MVGLFDWLDSNLEAWGASMRDRQHVRWALLRSYADCVRMDESQEQTPFQDQLFQATAKAESMEAIFDTVFCLCKDELFPGDESEQEQLLHCYKLLLLDRCDSDYALQLICPIKTEILARLDRLASNPPKRKAQSWLRRAWITLALWDCETPGKARIRCQKAARSCGLYDEFRDQLDSEARFRILLNNLKSNYHQTTLKPGMPRPVSWSLCCFPGKKGTFVTYKGQG